MDFNNSLKTSVLASPQWLRDFKILLLLRGFEQKHHVAASCFQLQVLESEVTESQFMEDLDFPNENCSDQRNW